MKNQLKHWKGFALYIALTGAVNCGAVDSLESAFRSPPAAAKPAIWWYWGESVTTDHGITKDLEALKRVGFGGVVLYEQVFADRADALKSLSPEWLARVRFAAAECARLGLTLEVNASDGYVAGGPWITPELAMQRLVASETNVDGGRTIAEVLPLPETRLNFYRDVAVLAYPTPAGGGRGICRRRCLRASRPESHSRNCSAAMAEPRRRSRVRRTGGKVLPNWITEIPSSFAASAIRRA